MASSIDKNTDGSTSIGTSADLEKTGSVDASGFGGLRIKHVEELKDSGAAVQEVRSAALAAATTVGGKTETWTRAAFVIYWATFVCFLCSCANGYDGSLMNAINGMAPYQAKFESGRLGPTTGIIFAIYTVGNMVGSFFAGPIADRYGRRFGMWTGCAIVIMGAIVNSSAETRAAFIAGRFVLGFGISIVTTAAPSYCVEIAPPAWRGRATGFYNCGWFGGSIPAAGITLGTSYMKNDWGWRIPLICQCVPAVIVCCSVFFLPESPRWLLANGRDDEARAFLVRFHGNGDPHSPIVDLEWAEFKEDISTVGSDKRWWDYRELFHNKNARRRTFMMVLMGVFGQFSGNGLGYFNLSIYEAVGYDYIMQFVLNLINSIVSAIGAGAGVAIADRAPRRPILIYGTFVCAIMLAINAGLSLKWAKMEVKDLSVGRGAVTAYFLFNIIYSFTYTPLQALYPVECLQTNSRAKGMALYSFTVSAVGFINAYAGPIALQNMKYNYIWCFVGWDIVESILWFLFCVETQGRTLEELDEIFSSAHPVAASKAKKKVIIEANTGTVLVAKA